LITDSNCISTDIPDPCRMKIQFSQKVNIITFFWQETDIAVVSLRHSEFGDIYAAHKYGNNLQSDN